jgi:hypothetical protein
LRSDTLTVGACRQPTAPDFAYRALQQRALAASNSGCIANPSNPRQTIKLKDVFLQGQSNAQGCFLGTHQSGVFLLESPRLEAKRRQDWLICHAARQTTACQHKRKKWLLTAQGRSATIGNAW